MPTTDEVPLLAIRDLAKLLRISDRHLRDIRTQDPTLPAPITVGASPRWRPQEVSDWLARYESNHSARAAAPVVKARPARRRSNPVAAAEQRAHACRPLRPEVPKQAWGLAEVQHHLNVSARTLRRLREQDPTFPLPRYLVQASAGTRTPFEPGSPSGSSDQLPTQPSSPSSPERHAFGAAGVCHRLGHCRSRPHRNTAGKQS